ncbi:MAG: hypothetical protein J6V42_00180 [Clostridia bacterium]|nr:hypothetical protein [Clostridia bacterium]
MQKIKGFGIGERAVIGKLRKARADAESLGGGILFFNDGIEASDILSLGEDTVGIVIVGEQNEDIVERIRARNISAIFIDERERELLSDGERAVLYPDRNTLFIAPQIEIVDDFSTRIRSETELEKAKGAVECREYFLGKAGAFLLLASEDTLCEEDAFRIYSEAAQECGFLPLIILMNVSIFKSYDVLTENLRAIIRATVYTRIIPTFGVSSVEEYEKMKSMLKGCARELSLEGREVPQSISCGILINSPHEAVCIDSYSSITELLAIDVDALTSDLSKEERERATESYLGVIEDKMSKGVLKVIYIGDKRSLEKCAKRMLGDSRDEKRSYFIIDSDNIKIKRNKNEKKY